MNFSLLGLQPFVTEACFYKKIEFEARQPQK